MPTPGQEKREQLRAELREFMDRHYGTVRNNHGRMIAEALVEMARACEREDVMIVVHRQIHSSHFMRVRQRVDDDAKRREEAWKNG